MAGLTELVARGVQLYGVGRIREAREAFQRVLALDPSNAQARAFLVHIREAVPAVTPFPGALAAVPLPPPAAPSAPASTAAPLAPPAARGGGAAPVPLPPPGGRAPAAAPAAPLPRARTSVVADAISRVLDPGGEFSAAPGPEGEFAPSPWDDGPAAAATIELEAAGGLDLDAVAEKSDLRPLVPAGAARAPSPRSDVEVWLAAAKELFALGDFTGSLELIEKILQLDPDHGEARDYLRHNEATLISMYESKLGSPTAIPRLAIKPEEVMWLNLDHRAGFLLAQIDGTVDYESLFALSGLPRLDTARILANLIADGVIAS